MITPSQARAQINAQQTQARAQQAQGYVPPRRWRSWWVTGFWPLYHVNDQEFIWRRIWGRRKLMAWMVQLRIENPEDNIYDKRRLWK